MVTLPFNLGGVIRDSITAYRRKNNIPEPEEVKALGVYRIRDTFFEYELELVRELELDKKSLEYIDLFPNITSLTIDGSNELESGDFKRVLDKYPKLEKLTIKGQSNIQLLNVSEMKNLKELTLISNRNLHRVVGLDKIEELEEITIYGNETYATVKELCEHVAKLSQNGTKCNFDVLYMPDMKKIGILNPDNFKWCESVGLGLFGNELKYDTEELEEAVNKAEEVISRYIKPTDNDKEAYAILYQWVCKNIKYDDESLDSRVHTIQGKEVGQFGGMNGTVNGLVYGSCVCEGYSKSMQMLLKLCGIPAFDIGCIASDKTMPMYNYDGKKKFHGGDHSILKVNLDGICYYSDVTWDADRIQNGYPREYFLLSKEDISKDHKLIDEADVWASPRSVSSEEFQELMKFAQERIDTIDSELAKKEEENKHKNTIAQVATLLGVSIPSDIDYIYDEKLKAPRVAPKNASTLREEQQSINKRLEELFYDGELDMKTYSSMKLEVLKEYNSLVSNLPQTKRPDTDDGNYMENLPFGMINANLHKPTISDEVIKQVFLHDKKQRLNEQKHQLLNQERIINAQRVDEEERRQEVIEQDNGMTM